MNTYITLAEVGDSWSHAKGFFIYKHHSYLDTAGLGDYLRFLNHLNSFHDNSMLWVTDNSWQKLQMENLIWTARHSIQSSPASSLNWCNFWNTISPLTWTIWSGLISLSRDWKQLWETSTNVGRLICPEGCVSSLNKYNPNPFAWPSYLAWDASPSYSWTF